MPNTNLGKETSRSFTQKSYYLWRLLATAFAFLIFGAGGAVIVLCITIFFLLFPVKTQRKIAFTRTAVQRSFALYLQILKHLKLLTFEIRGRENIPAKSSIVIANHPSLLDVVFLISLIDQTDCIIKDSLLRNWLTRFPAKAAAYVSNESKSLIDEVTNKLRTSPLILFPEGTRSEPNKPLKFQRGAANIALFANAEFNCPITPVTITCYPATLLRSQRWYHIPPSPPHFTITFHQTIHVKEIIADNLPHSKASRLLTHHLQDFFAEQLSPGGNYSTTD